MAISLNSIVGFNSTLPAKYKDVSRSSIRASTPKATQFTFSSGIIGSRVHIKEKRGGFCLSVADSDRLATDTSDEALDNAESVDNESGTQTSGPSNGSTVSSNVPKRSPLTARERLKAARVLSRYTESRTTKSEMGSKVLDALKESDKGKKRSGLPEAPMDLFDDSKRGLPKDGWTFQFPGGNDLFVIALSFVLISTIMFTTTYIVWKVGAIHFNEY
ncbi:hypothetical protein JCGZ_01241 [Jatropha curcas]|uniref:Uncharacterized protein n=1 Tax=Jatropha curcas TaxID=180498 RepID=A0A067L8I5_JATCU|nr:uncharacterized protein LOC105645974 [Jatropha curcas]KDP44741.1 hypothetical protein JCGZ_01241 [Jatropha curcas]